MSQKRRLHLQISGRVQGVAFRAAAMREARALELSGWIRNLPDGRVEVLAEGSDDQLEKFEEWCHTGPPAASVSNVERQWLDFIGDLGPFTIRYG